MARDHHENWLNGKLLRFECHGEELDPKKDVAGKCFFCDYHYCKKCLVWIGSRHVCNDCVRALYVAGKNAFDLKQSD